MLECPPLLCSVLGDVEFTGCRRVASITYDNAKFVLLRVTYQLKHLCRAGQGVIRFPGVRHNEVT